MDKYEQFGNLLYRLSNFEKARCDPKKSWGKSYKNSLYASLRLMDKIIKTIFIDRIHLSEQDELQMIEEVTSIVNCEKDVYLNENTNVNLSIPSDTVQQYDEVNQLMVKIITQAISCLQKSNKRNRMAIWYLLHAFHNLPRVYSNSLTDNSTPISPQEALEYAYSDLEHINL